MRQEIDMEMTLPHDEQYHFDNFADLLSEAIRGLIQHSHARSYNAGWWQDPVTGADLIPPHLNGSANEIREQYTPYVLATKIALIHSEVSEMLEAIRTDVQDNKLPEFKGVTVESADVMIRVADLMGMLTMLNKNAYEYDLASAILAKFWYNKKRGDHSVAQRLDLGGKKF